MSTEHGPRWQIPFFTIWTGQQLSWIGSALAQFALVWWLTETTGSATVLAIGTLISVLPGIVLGPLVGALVDRWNRRVVMLVADSTIVYVVMLVRAIGGTFHWPAMTASTSLMVPKEHLPRIAGLNQTIGGAVNIISPPLGALLLNLLPLHAIMAIDVVTAAFAIAPLLFVHIPQPRRTVAATDIRDGQATLWTDMREGLRYVWGWPGLLAVAGLAMVLNFLITPAMSLAPILVTSHFNGEVLQLGWMNSAWGFGLVLGGVILGVWGGFRRRVVTMLMGIVGLGLGVLLVGLTPAAAFPLALVGLFFGAVMNSMCNGSAHALLQQVVTPEMQGRVFTLVVSLCNAATPLGMAIGGPVADAVGVRTLYVVGGVAQILLGIGGFFVPAIMHLEHNNHNGRTTAEVVERETPVPIPVSCDTRS
jgi:DHA3 family macrolide efflux protein-like MFS transporter